MSRFSPEMLELYELQRKMIAERSAPQGTATSQPVESRDDIIRRKMLEYNAPPDPSQSQPESIDQWTRIRNYLGDQLTTGQDSPYPVEDARPATPGDYAEQGPAYQQQFRDALAREDAPAPPPPAPFSMGAIPELTAQGAQAWKERVDAIERAGQPIDTSPEAQASRRRNRALSEIGAQSPQKAAEVAALLENTRPATIANTIPQSDLPSGADMIALQGLTPIADAATFLPRMAAKMLPGDEPQFSKDYLNMADLREFNEQVPSRSAVEGAGRLASGLGGEVGAFFVPGAMPIQKGVANLTSRMAARALPTSSKMLAGARNLGAGVVGFELPHYAETVLGGGAHGEAAMNPLGAPFRLVRDVLGDVSGSLEHPGVINVIRNAGYYADMTPESLDLLRRNLAPATILALPMALHKMGDAGKAKAAEIKDALKSGDPARVQKAVSDMDAPMRDQVARTADDLITLQRTITPPPMPLTQMPQSGRVVRLGEAVGDREAAQMERAGFLAPGATDPADAGVPRADVPAESLTDALNRARQHGPNATPTREGATDEATARTSQPEGAQGGEATPRLEGAGPPQAARPQQGSRLEALAAGTPINTVNGMTLAARFNEWLESSGRPIVRSQAEFLEWLDRPRADNRPPAEDPSAPSMTEQFLAWAQKNPSTIQPPAPTQSPQAPAPTLKDRMAAMRMNPVPEKPGGFSLTAALRARMVGAEVKPPMSTPETPIPAETPVAPEAKPAAKPVASETKPTESAPRAKEPWEMTRAEYSKSGPFLPERGATETRGQLGGEFVDRSIYIHEEMFAKLSPGVKRYGVSPREAVVMHERMHDVWEQAVGQATVGGNEIWKITIQELEKIPKSTGVDVIGKRSMVERAVETLTVDSLAPERLSTAERAWASKVKALAHKNEVATALSAGRAVPPEVLKDYPDLAAKYASQAAPASEQVPPFTPDTPRGSVYRIRFKDKGEMYAVRESDNPRGGGDPIFESLADARKHAEGLPERDRVAQEQRESREAAAREKAEQETAAKAKRENLSGFGDDLPPMKKALAVKVLDAQVRSDGKVYKLRDLIAEKVQEGFTVEENSSHDAAARKKLEAEFGRIAQTAPIGNENHPQTQRYLELKKNLADPSFPQKTTRVLSHPDGRVNDSFNKTALDYAEHLIKARNESPARRPGDVETTPDKKRSFEVDEELVMRSPHTGEDTNVSFRGAVDNNAVVWTGKTQMSVPLDWLRRPGDAPPQEAVVVSPPQRESAPPTAGTKPLSKTTKEELAGVVLGSEPTDAMAKFEWRKKLEKLISSNTKGELISRIESDRKDAEKQAAVDAAYDRVYPEVKTALDEAGAGWRSKAKEIAAQHGVRGDLMASHSRNEGAYYLSRRIAEKQASLTAAGRPAGKSGESPPVTTPEKSSEAVKADERQASSQAEGPKEGLLTPKPPAQGDTNRPSAQGEPPHFAVYNDKVIPMDYIPDPKQQFRFAGQRIIDNNAEGFVVTPKGEVFSITKGSRRAKPVTGEAKQVALDKVASYQSARPAAPRETVVKVSDLPKFIVGGKSFDTLPKARKEAIRRVEMGPSRVYQVASVERAPKMSFSPASWLREFADAVPGFKGNPVFVEKGGKLHYNDGQGGTYDINPTWLGITRPLNAGEQVRVDFSKGEAPAPREVPVGGKGLVTDAGDVARVEAAKEVIKKAVKDSQSRLGTLGGTLEPYFNREFARAVGDIASIYTKAVMKQGYAQLLEYTDAAFGRFKEFLATHLPEHADVLGRVQGGKFLRRVWARAVASQKDLKGLGMAEKKAAMRAREAFVTGEKVERGRVSLRKAMGAARRDAERPMISLELSHGLTPEMVKRIRGEDRIDALRAMDEVANPIGEIGGVQEALRALEKNGGKIRNLSPQQIDTLAAVAETFSRVSENARALHKDGKILDVDEFAVEGAGDVMKDKPFDLDRRPITGRIARALGLKKRGSEDPFETDAELRENAMGVLRYIHDGASEPYQMVENFFGRGSKVYDWFFNSKEGMRGGDTLAKEAEMKARDPVEKVLVETGLNRETEEAKFRFEKRKYRAGSQELELTDSEALSLYNNLRATGGNGKRIEENGFKLFTHRNRKGKTDLTSQDAQSFVDNVPARIRVLSDAMMESGRALHGYWARMYERIFGVRAGDRGPNYWPILTDTSMRRSMEMTLDKYLPTGDLVDSPFTKKRAEMTGEPILITDALGTWRSMVTQQSRYAGLAEPLLKMRAIINHPDVRDALVRKYGQKVLDKFNTMLEIQSGFRERMGGPEVAGVNKWIKDKTTSVTGPLLSGSLRAQVMSNLTGSLQYMKEADGKDFNTAVFGLAKDIWAGRYGELRESLKENGYLHNRLDTPTRRLATPAEWRNLDPTEHKVVEVLNRMNDWIGKNFAGRWDDLNTVLAYKIAEAKAAREGRNLSRSDLLTEAEKLVRLTQNPSSLFDMSVTAADARETWWGSMYFFIQNGALKARSSLERSIHKGGTEAVKGIALAGLETLGGRIAQTAQWAATALPFMADNDKRKDPGRVAESNLAQAVAEVVDLIVPGAGIAVRQAHAAWQYNKAPNFSPLADVQQAMVQVGGTVWGGVAEAMGLRKESKTPTSRKLYKATLELLRAMAPFYRIPPQFMTPLREAMREKPARKPFR